MTDPLKQLEGFLIDNYEPCQMWDAGTIPDWLLWAAGEGYLFIVTDKDQKPIGMTIARPVEDPEGVTGPSADHDPAAGNIYIDLTITRCKYAMKALMLKILGRFGDRDKICFHRAGKEHPVKYYDYWKFSSKILRS